MSLFDADEPGRDDRQSASRALSGSPRQIDPAEAARQSHGIGSGSCPAAPLDLASRLNPSQLAAATYQGGPLLIVAGAGSGKTRTLVHRVAWLVDGGLHPASVLLLTFTRKAASEMLGRAAALVGRRASQVAGGTFHSLANALLRPYAHLLGYPAGFGIMDQDDAESLISRIRAEEPEVKRRKRFPQKGAILSIISRAVNKDQSLLETLTDAFPHFLEFAPVIDKIAGEYREHKLKNALMDFDDLLVGLEKIMAEHEEARQRIAGRYRHILVDEYQDTNPVQARLTELLGRDHRQVTAVGDDAQSIYAFRGASFRNIMDFPKIFPDARIMKLEENYRSREPILVLANSLIAQAREKYDKKLVARRGPGSCPQLVAVQDQAEEAGWVAAKVESLLAEGLALSDIAVLFRAASHSFDLEVELVRRRVPFTKYGGRKFLESAHIKDFLAFLRVSANPADGLSLRRILMMIEGVGPRGAQDIDEWVDGRPERAAALAQAPATARARKNLAPLADLMAKLMVEDQSLAARVKLTADYYWNIIKDLYPDDWPDRQADLKELLRMAESREDDLRSFLADLTLDPPNQKKVGPEEKGEAGLTLSTIHSAKGLEWKVVIILSAVEGRFPPGYAARSAAEVEEERRLMYVAVTRAEDELFIMLPLGEMDYRTGLAARPSRFLAALPPDGGLSLWQNGREVDPSMLLELGGDFGRGESDFFRSGKEVPTGSPARPRVCEPKAESPGRPLAASRAEAPAGIIPELGQRVSHPVYGPGKVLEINGPQAIIDFDHFGRKNVTMQYARLTPLS